MKIKFTSLLLLLLCQKVSAASFSDTVDDTIRFEVKKAPVELSLKITPAELTEKEYEDGKLVANATVSAKDGNAYHLAIRFSNTSSHQATEDSGTKTILTGESSGKPLPLYIKEDFLQSGEINGVQMSYVVKPTNSHTFDVVLAGRHIIYADTYLLRMEGAIYNP